MCLTLWSSRVKILVVWDWSKKKNVPNFNKTIYYNKTSVCQTLSIFLSNFITIILSRELLNVIKNQAELYNFSYNLALDFNLDENELRNNITLLYMELPKAVRMQIGHQFSTGSLKGFFHSCLFLEEDCNKER